VTRLLPAGGRTTETIREQFKRRKRRALTVVSIGIAVSVTAVGCLLGEIGGSRFQPALLGVAVLGLAIMFAGMLYLDRTRCPRCLGRSGPILFTPSTNFCPQCGVSLDIPTH
jgi:hypothetical protein